MLVSVLERCGEVILPIAFSKVALEQRVFLQLAHDTLETHSNGHTKGKKKKKAESELSSALKAKHLHLEGGSPN